MVAVSVSNGSRISRKPLSYVDVKVANEATFCKLLKCSKSVNSSVRTRLDNLSAQNRRGFLSIYVTSFKCCKKEAGVSATTCITLRRVYIKRHEHLFRMKLPIKTTFKYSMNLLRNATKCSALLMLPGTASFNKSSGKIGFAMKVSSSLAVLASRNPSTNFVYSFFNR